MTEEQTTRAARVVLDATLDRMQAKSGLSRLEIMQAVAAGVPAAVKMFTELGAIGLTVAETLHTTIEAA